MSAVCRIRPLTQDSINRGLGNEANDIGPEAERVVVRTGVRVAVRGIGQGAYLGLRWEVWGRAHTCWGSRGFRKVPVAFPPNVRLVSTF